MYRCSDRYSDSSVHESSVQRSKSDEFSSFALKFRKENFLSVCLDKKEQLFCDKGWRCFRSPFRDRGQFTLLHTQIYFYELSTSVLNSLIPCTETLAFQKSILNLLIKWSIVIATFLSKRPGTFSKDLPLLMDSPQDDTCWKYTFKFGDLCLHILFVFLYFSTLSKGQFK